MSRIDRITIQTYRYTLDDFGPSIAVYQPGGKLSLTRFIVTIDTDDGLSGSYAPHFGATPHAQAQVAEMAHRLIGLDPEHREHVFERLKLSHRHYDKSGIAAIDTALWDLAGKKYGVPIARLLGGFRERLPVYASTTSCLARTWRAGQRGALRRLCRVLPGGRDSRVQDPQFLRLQPENRDRHHVRSAPAGRPGHEAHDRSGVLAEVVHGCSGSWQSLRRPGLLLVRGSLPGCLIKCRRPQAAARFRSHTPTDRRNAYEGSSRRPTLRSRAARTSCTSTRS